MNERAPSRQCRSHADTKPRRRAADAGGTGGAREMGEGQCSIVNVETPDCCSVAAAAAAVRRLRHRYITTKPHYTNRLCRRLGVLLAIAGTE